MSTPKAQTQDAELAAVQQELEELNLRRRELEEKRRHIADQSQQRSRQSSQQRPSSASRLAVMTLDHGSYIASEKERRELTEKNSLAEMKTAMRQSWENDSALVGGFFCSKDNPKNSTFGRSRRFTPVVGMKGQYHLSTDVMSMQEQAKNRQRKHYSVANRGKVGCNVNGHWNDSKGGAAPGPGAYTPRYQKVAPPVRQ